MSTTAQWESFQSGSATVGVHEDLLTSWRRSQWSGINPHDVEIPHTDVPTDSPLRGAGEPVLQRMAETLAQSHTSLALADRRGNVLWRWTSDAALGAELDSVDMVAGANFNEAAVGTNGIGTALETRRLAVVIGPDHFVGSFHRWACAAAPIRHPITGAVVGAANLTCRVQEANQFFRWAAQSMADDVTRALDVSINVRERRLYEAYLALRHRSTVPIAALDEHTFVADEVASNCGLDRHRLWETVRGASEGTVVDLSPDLKVRVHPVDPHAHTGGVVVEILIDRASSAPLPAPRRPMYLSLHRHLSPLELVECEAIVAAMADHHGNKTAVAAYLEISRGTLYQKLAKYRIGT